MRRLLIIFVAALGFSIAANAYEQAIRDISIRLELQKDGSARISERWDVSVADGTEWYLVRQNLGDIRVSDLRVSDETGREFTDIGVWDVDCSLRQKEGKCGIVQTGKGVEICWGVGSYGDHVFNVSYTMSNVVKSLNDYDMLHMQLVSPGLSSRPENVSVSISSPVAQIDTSWARAWGFGFVGSCHFSDGRVIYQSTERFRSNSSVIALLRFDKGVFESPSRQARSFEDVYATAIEGSDYEDEDDDEGVFAVIIMFFAAMFGCAGLAALAVKARKKQILGMKPSEVGWCRDIPFDGELVQSNWTLKQLGESKLDNSIASAIILRMIYNGYLSVSKDADGKLEISFSGKGDSGLGRVEAGLYDMMLKASGSDRILQDKEFSRWSKRHTSEVAKWVKLCESEGTRQLASNGYTRGLKFTPEGQQQARNLLGFKKYLSDFTLINERETIEVALWKEYLVFGALYGMAEKVAQQLKDIDPKVFEQVTGYDSDTLGNLILRTHYLSRAITNSNAAYAATTQAKGGFGGGTSFGGGGGFSGGGFGGGSR